MRPELPSKRKLPHDLADDGFAIGTKPPEDLARDSRDRAHELMNNSGIHTNVQLRVTESFVVEKLRLTEASCIPFKLGNQILLKKLLSVSCRCKLK